MSEVKLNAKLPDFLKRTPEQKQAEAERQTLARNHAMRVRQTPEDKKIALAAEREPVIRENLRHLKKNTPEYKDTAVSLAEVLAAQGKFDAAAAAVRGRGRIEYYRHYKEMSRAVEMGDKETCDCPPVTAQISKPNARGEIRQTATEIPNTFIAAFVPSEKHGCVMPLVKCAKCGHANVRAE